MCKIYYAIMGNIILTNMYLRDRGKGVKMETGFYSERLVQTLINSFKMPARNVK